MEENQVVSLVNNPHNLRRFKRALAIARKVEGRSFRLCEAIEIKWGNLYLWSGYLRIDRYAARLLTHDWQAGRLENMPPMEHAAQVYFRYFRERMSRTAGIEEERGYLFPDGHFSVLYEEIEEPTSELCVLLS